MKLNNRLQQKNYSETFRSTSHGLFVVPTIPHAFEIWKWLDQFCFLQMKTFGKSGKFATCSSKYDHQDISSLDYVISAKCLSTRII